MNKYSLHNLKSGLRVALIPNVNTAAVTVLVLVKTGSRLESTSMNGASHFIEHMMFKGTTKRPKPTDMSIELEGVGAAYNAFTSKEYTGYYVKLAADKIDMAVDIISDMLVNPKFPRAELERERGVILEEIKMYEDNPQADIDNLFEAVLYQGHPLARPVIGPRRNIQKIKRTELLKYKNQYYYGANSIVAVAGKYNKSKTLELLEQKFKKFNSRKTQSVMKEFDNRQKETRVKIKYKKTEQSHLILGFPAFQDDDPRTSAAKLLSVILGSGMSSRLFIQVREKQGLCYSIYAGLTTYEDAGDIMIKAGLDTTRLEPAIRLILSELKKIKKSPVGYKELKKAKDYIQGSSVLALEDSEAQAGWYARELIYGEKIETPVAKLKKIRAITPKQIQKVAKELFQTHKLNLALIGPISAKHETKIRRLLEV